MTRREYRIAFGVLLLSALVILIVRVSLARYVFDADMIWWLVGAVALAMVIHILYARYQRRLVLANDIALLRGALWDLVRLMENYPTRSAGRRAGGRAQLLERFAVKGAKEVGAGREMPMGGTGALDLTTLAFELIDRNEKDGAGHWRRVNGIRRGCYTFLAMAALGALDQAYRAMIDHMIRQRERADGVDNFPELKALLGLPIGVPQPDWTWLENAARTGLTLERSQELDLALRKGMKVAFSGLHYKPWPEGDAPEIEYRGQDILAQMREYIR